jgi:hypothetical protein
LQIQAFTSGVSCHNQPDIPFFNGTLDVLALNGSEILSSEQVRFSLRLHRCRQPHLCRDFESFSPRICGVIILAENDAAVLKPGFSLARKRCQEMLNRVDLGITRFRTRQFLNDNLKVSGFLSRKLRSSLLQNL